MIPILIQNNTKKTVFSSLERKKTVLAEFRAATDVLSSHSAGANGSFFIRLRVAALGLSGRIEDYNHKKVEKLRAKADYSWELHSY